MNSAWSKFTLSDVPVDRWRGGSFIYRAIGSLSSWQQGSWLLQWSESLGALLVSCVLVLAPFVSTSLIGLLLFAAACYWILITISTNSNSGITPIHLIVFFYWCVATVAMALSPVKKAAFSGWIEFTLYLIFFALSARILRSPRITAWVMTALLLVSLVVSSYGIRQQFYGVEQLATWNDPNSALAKQTRVYSYLGNPNLLASYLFAAIALSIAAVLIWRGWIQKTLALIMVAVNVACMYFTGSRGGWLGMLVAIIVFLLLLHYWWAEYLPQWARIWLLPLVFGTLFASLAIALIFVEPLRLRIMSIFAGREDSSNNFRIHVWEAVEKMIHDRPILGIGPGHDAFNQVYPRYMDSRYPALSAYSIYLETIVELGIFGFSCFVWLIVITINQGLVQLKRLRAARNPQGLWLIAAIATIAAMAVHGMVDTVWYRPQINTLWWLMLGLVASQYQSIKIEGRHGEGRF